MLKCLLPLSFKTTKQLLSAIVTEEELMGRPLHTFLLFARGNLIIAGGAMQCVLTCEFLSTKYQYQNLQIYLNCNLYLWPLKWSWLFILHQLPLSIQPWLPHDPPFSSSLAAPTSSRIPSIPPTLPASLAASVFTSRFLYLNPAQYLPSVSSEQRGACKVGGKWGREGKRREDSRL